MKQKVDPAHVNFYLLFFLILTLLIFFPTFLCAQEALAPDTESETPTAQPAETTVSPESEENRQGGESIKEGVRAIIAPEKVFASLEKLEVDPITGTATANIPVAVASGRAGIQPSITLLYNSSSPNGSLGVGWILELGNIQRSVKKGIPKYDSSDTFVLTQAGSTQELVFDSVAGFYRQKVEGAFMKIEFDAGNSKWVVTDKKGIKYYFGQSNASRQLDPANGSRIFKWCLDRVEDLSGNYMTISYDKDQNQIYPLEIVYTGNAQTGLTPFASVVFNFSGPRSDSITSYLTGFKVTTAKKLASIDITGDSHLIRSYRLTYGSDPQTNKTLLTQMTQVASDNNSSLPSTIFTYSSGQEEFGSEHGISNPPDDYLHNGLSRLTDVNGDGYVDLVRSPSNGWHYRIFINNHNLGFNPYVETNVEPPVQFNGNVEALDLNGDGLPDIIYGEANAYKVYINNGAPNGNDFTLRNVSGSPSIWLSDPNIRLVDFDGDGFPDLIRSDPENHKIYRNNKQGDFSGPSVLANSPSNLGFNNGDLRLADFNGDGRLDLIHEDGGQCRIWINNGADGYYPPVSVNNFPVGHRLAETITQVVDINGDGLTDIVYSQPGNYSVYLNNGKNDFDGPITAANSPDKATNDEDTRFIDINGDGLLDILIGERADLPYKIWLNNGSDGFRPPVNATNHPWAESQDGDLMFVDFNKDGLTDMVYGLPSNYRVWIHNYGSSSSKGGVLVSINNSMGAATAITYENVLVKPLVGSLYFFAASPVLFNVVQSTTTTVLNSSYVTRYLFRDGLWNFAEREFRGFGYAKITDPQNSYSESWFEQNDNFKKGRVLRQESRDSSNNLFAKTVPAWGDQEIAPGIHFVFLQQEDNFIYDGDATGKRTQEQYFYNESPQYGDVTKVVSLGEVDLNSGGDIGNDTRSAETEYSTNASLWLLGLPKHAIGKDNGGNIVRQSRFYYDGHNDDLNAPPTKGLVTKKEDWLDGSETWPSSIFTYDEYGNLKTTRDALDHVTSIDFDPVYALYPLRTTNALSHQVISEYYGVNGVALDSGDGYHGLWGQLKSTTDPNNKQGRKTYDVFGRITATVSPLDSVEYPTSAAEYQFASDYVTVTTRQREKSGEAGTIDSVQFYDGLGRLIQAKSESATPGQFIVSGQTEYNSRGLPEKKYLPFFSTNPMNTIDPINPNVPHTTISYDAMGRAVQTTNPDGTRANVVYDDWTNTTIDENGHKQKSYADAYGRLIKKEEYSGADGRADPIYPVQAYTLYATTLYTYDSEGNLTQTQDAQGNITTINYDTLGRKVSMNDPDMGYWQYYYDAVGNLDYQIDAKNQRIDFHYDVLNRLANKTDGGSLNVDYTYDDDSVPNSKGRLTRVDYPVNANTKFYYDDIGREIESVKRINSTNYAVARNYDAVSRLTSLQYPDQAQVQYVYNNAGQIKQIYNIADSDPYTKLLVHSDGQDGSTTFLDSSASSHSITANGNAQIDTAQSKFGGSSALFDGDGDYLSVLDSDDWNFGAGDFTIDFWVSLPDGNLASFLDQYQDADNNWKVFFYANKILVCFTSGGVTIGNYAANYSPSFGDWDHIAIERIGSGFQVYINGTLTEITTYAPFGTGDVGNVMGPLNIGTYNGGFPGYHIIGHLDELRISKGIARWTTDFTPPTEPYSSDVQNYVSNVTYNPSGQITEIDYGNGDVTTYAYDPTTLRLNRLLTVNIQQQVLQDLNYTYDSAGNILTITDSVHTNANQTFQYDALNRLTQAVGSYGTKNYTYDEIGNITSKDNHAYTYGENGAGPHAVTSLSDGTVFTYDSNGNMATQTKSGQLTDYIYNAENRLVEVKKNSQTRARYEYDGDGGRTKKTVYSGTPGGPTCFLAGTPILMADGTTKHIEEVKAGDMVESFSEKTNKKVASKVTELFVHEKSADEYLIVNDSLKATPNHLFYSQGRWVRIDSLPMTAKLLDSNLAEVDIKKIESVKTTGKITVYNLEVETNHNYFAGGLLVHNRKQLYEIYNGPYSKNNNLFNFRNYADYTKDAVDLFFDIPDAEAAVTQKTTVYVGSLYEINEGLPTKYIFLGGTRVASIDNGQVLYYHGNHLGSTDVVTNGVGEQVVHYEYEPYGVVTATQGSDVSEFKFTGKPLDDETGLYYYGARYYNPVIGRFITPDTVVQAPDNPQTLNRYSYCNNNPISLIDPTGHSWWSKFSQKVLPHIFNFIRVVSAIAQFPVNPVGSTLEIASVAASYDNGDSGKKSGKILGWASQAWNVGQGIYNANDRNEVTVVRATDSNYNKLEKVTDYRGIKRTAATGIRNDEKAILRFLKESNDKGVHYDAVIWNKTHGTTSDFVESAVEKLAGSRALAQSYKETISAMEALNPSMILDVHSEATIIATNAFRSMADSLGDGIQVNFLGPAVAYSTARSAYAIAAGAADNFKYVAHTFDPIYSLFGSTNPVQMIGGTVGGIMTGAHYHSMGDGTYGYLSQVR